MVFEQGVTFIVPHVLWHRALVLQSHPEDRPVLSPFWTGQGHLLINKYNTDTNGANSGANVKRDE